MGQSLLGALLVLSVSCTTASDPPSLTPADTGRPASPTRVALEVPGFLPAVLSLPDPKQGKKPLLVVGHGAGDSPEYSCEWWEKAVGGRAAILCLRGSAAYPRDPNTGYYYKTHYALEKEALAALKAVREKHGDALADGPALYTGFSQGAIMGALFASQHGDLFDRLILIEGGFDEWDVRIAMRFKKAGGVRVLLACGNEYCARHAQESARRLRRGGIEARVEHAPGAGHTYDGEVGRRVLDALDWLTEGDPRWK